MIWRNRPYPVSSFPVDVRLSDHFQSCFQHTFGVCSNGRNTTKCQFSTASKYFDDFSRKGEMKQVGLVWRQVGRGWWVRRIAEFVECWIEFQPIAVNRADTVSIRLELRRFEL